MASGKKSKNNPSNKQSTQKTVLVLSSECEACQTQCEKGLKYIEKIKSGKCGKGVVCNKKSTS